MYLPSSYLLFHLRPFQIYFCIFVHCPFQIVQIRQKQKKILFTPSVKYQFFYTLYDHTVYRKVVQFKISEIFQNFFFGSVWSFTREINFTEGSEQTSIDE